MSRQIVLDTETTGFDHRKGDRIVEIGCIEILDRTITDNHFHVYINPERDMPPGAFEVHGLSEEFLSDKPVFAEIGQSFIDYVDGAELIIHNAPFDIGFLNFELTRMGLEPIDKRSSVIDTLQMAREMYPSQRNTLDALCSRLGVDNSNRTLHGALLDSELLAQVYLNMTGGQESLFGLEESTPSMEQSFQPFGAPQSASSNHFINEDASTSLVENVEPEAAIMQRRIIRANSDELKAHEAFMAQFQQKD